MSNLKRTIDGQIVQFVELPKIFNSLAEDLPSGSVVLNKETGEVAYWRLTRNLLELKKYNKNVREIATKLAGALKAIVVSDAFKNHYGLATSPELPAEADLVNHFRNLVQLNNNRVDYSTTYHGKNKPMVESIQIPLGNLVFFNAIRGNLKDTRSSGLKGTATLLAPGDIRLKANEAPYKFTITSPFLDLSTRIGPDRLAEEISKKLLENLPALVSQPVIEFNDGQFKDYTARGLQELIEKNPHPVNGAKKSKKEKKREREAQQQEGKVVPANAMTQALEKAKAAETAAKPAVVTSEFRVLEIQRDDIVIKTVVFAEDLISNPGDVIGAFDELKLPQPWYHPAFGLVNIISAATFQGLPADITTTEHFKEQPAKVIEDLVNKMEEISGAALVVSAIVAQTEAPADENDTSNLAVNGDPIVTDLKTGEVVNVPEGQLLDGQELLSGETIAEEAGDKFSLVVRGQTYVVTEGDSLEDIAEKVYGDKSYAIVLAAANGLYNGDDVNLTEPVDSILELSVPEITDPLNTEFLESLGLVVAGREVEIGDTGTRVSEQAVDAAIAAQVAEDEVGDHSLALAGGDSQTTETLLSDDSAEAEDTRSVTFDLEAGQTQPAEEAQAEIPQAWPDTEKAETPVSAELQQEAQAELDASFAAVEPEGIQVPTTVPEDAITTGMSYTVKSGDSLWKIAERAYGDGELWPMIRDANAEKIQDPNLIYPEQVFYIPMLQQPG